MQRAKRSNACGTNQARKSLFGVLVHGVIIS
jgi:hypothetical protein